MPEIHDKSFLPPGQIYQRPARSVERGSVSPTPPGTPGTSFDTLLQREIARGGELKFSAHAQKRLEQAKITLDSQQVARLNAAIEKAADKGARESLVLMDNLALVVSIRNRTVITAVDGERMKHNVFTNIDSAVIT